MVIQIMLHIHMPMSIQLLLSGFWVLHIDEITGVILAGLLHGWKEDLIIILFRAQFIVPLLDEQNRGLVPV